jgi:hypothetical protein
MERAKSVTCAICGRKVRTRFGASFSNRATQYPADHKDTTGKPCDGYAASIEWHLKQVAQ